MTIDPFIADLLAMTPPSDPEAERRIPVAQRRDAIEAGFASMLRSLPAGPTFDDVTVAEITVPGPQRNIPVRIFRPRGDDRELPAVLYFFGGGYWMRSYDSPDIIGACEQMCSQARVVVVEIDYALAPEHPFPAALEEGLAVLEWMAGGGGEHRIDPTRLAVGGQSAGGGLAASLALRVRDSGGPALSLQILEVPAVDLSLDQFDSPLPEGLGVLDGLSEIIGFYLPEGLAPEDPAVSPVRTDDLSNLPATLIIGAEHDPLRPSGELFANRLRSAGVTVVSTTYGGQVHNSPGLSGISAGSRAWREQVSWAVRTLHSPNGALS